MTWRPKRSWVILLFVGFTTAKCSSAAFDGIVAADAKSDGKSEHKSEKNGSGDKSKPNDATTPPAGPGDKSSKPDDGGVDDPIWINGSFLTCAWNNAGAKDSVAASCSLTSTAGAINTTTLHWEIVDMKGNVLAENARISPEAGDKVEVVMSGTDFTKMGLQASTGATAIFARASFKKLLPGLKDTDTLALCFGQGIPSAKCMNAAASGEEAVRASRPPVPSDGTGTNTGGGTGSSFIGGASSVDGGTEACQYGMSWSDSCWRRSEPGESCEMTCSTHGGNNAGTVSMLTNLCQLVSGFLGDNDKPWSGEYADCSKGVGCYADAQKRYMCTNGNITLQATTKTRRFCSCVR